ncbi:hypothetical protein KAW50_02645 [candidate division WOR-3 bacterium]|nr:hypothetical protein [candidate division WOR-3 bacterium]
MAVPAKVTGGGPNDATQCFKISFSTALSQAPTIESWDNSQAYPATDEYGTTTAKEIFTGTTVNSSYPMLAAWSGGAESSGNLPGSATWHPSSPVVGSNNPNLLIGVTSYVTCTNTPGAGGDTVFNLSLKAPSDATVPSTIGMAHLVQVRFYYTGAAPVLAVTFNEGTEAIPSWTILTPGTHGIQYCEADTLVGNYQLTLPQEGLQKTAPEVWVTT